MRYRVPVTWMVAGDYIIEADSVKHCLEIVSQLPDHIQPDNGIAMAGTQNIDLDAIEQYDEDE